jgi:hypothetical protein
LRRRLKIFKPVLAIMDLLRIPKPNYHKERKERKENGGGMLPAWKKPDALLHAESVRLSLCSLRSLRSTSAFGLTPAARRMNRRHVMRKILTNYQDAACRAVTW